MRKSLLFLLPLTTLALGASVALLLPALSREETMVDIADVCDWDAELASSIPLTDWEALPRPVRRSGTASTTLRAGVPRQSDGRLEKRGPEGSPSSGEETKMPESGCEDCEAQVHAGAPGTADAPPSKPEPSAVRVDPLPEKLDGRWPESPEAQAGDEGGEGKSLEKKKNPVLELGKFWKDEEEREAFEVTRSGTYEVKKDRAVNLEAGKTTRLKGRIVDAETGVGLPDASVVLFSTFYKRQVFYDHHLHEVAGVVTSGDGRFEIANFNVEAFHFGSAGKAFLTVICEGYVSRVGAYLDRLLPGVENDAGEIPLEKGGLVLRGRVFGRKGEPVVGATVACTGEIFPTEYSKDQRYKFLPRFPHAITDVDGTFEIRGILGRHWVTVHVGPDSVASVLGDYYGPAPPKPLVFSVLAGGWVEGRIVDAEDRPVADAVVYGGQNSTHSYADGSFRLENIEGTLIDVVVRHHLFRTENFGKARVGEGGLKIVLHHRLPRVVFLVRDGDSTEPVADVRIRFGPAEALGPNLPDSPLYRDDGGRFTVVVPEGARFATVETEHHRTQQIGFETVQDGQEIEVTLQRTSE
ncbi:MAG: hypothetical protein ACYS47_20710 [Planctomycetota bacterium]|jgi:protocatechuate 3,4-dioxygenase beta subunit